MKYCKLMNTFLLAILLVACADVTQQAIVQEPIEDGAFTTQIDHELLLDLNYIPHDVGISLSLIQDPQLYEEWAEIFQFPSVPAIDFDTEEVLFITTYTNSCGSIFENVTKEGDALFVQINYPKSIQQKKQIACNEIAIPKTFVVKMQKTGATYGTLKDVNRIVLEKEKILYEMTQE